MKETVNPNVELPGWVSTREAAEILGCSTKYVDRLIAYGVIPEPVRLYRRLRVFKREVIEQYRDTHPRLGERKRKAERLANAGEDKSST